MSDSIQKMQSICKKESKFDQLAQKIGHEYGSIEIGRKVAAKIGRESIGEKEMAERSAASRRRNERKKKS